MSLSSRQGSIWFVWVAVALSGCAGIHHMDVGAVSSTTLEQLRSDPAPLASAVTEGRPVVIRLRAGDELPIRLAVTSPVFVLRAGENALRFERDAYLYIAQRTLMVSPDGERWAELSNARGLRKLFELGRGTFAIGFGVTEQDGPFVTAAAGVSSAHASQASSSSPPASSPPEPDSQRRP